MNWVYFHDGNRIYLKQLWVVQKLEIQLDLFRFNHTRVILLEYVRRQSACVSYQK